MASTNHAEHFLTRIDRLNTPQAELALALYRDDELLKFVLGLANVPASVDRVAIALGESDTGPYVIVTRDGKFVTCLAEGMRLQADQVLISRRKLEHLSGKVEALRGLFEDARAGKRRRCDELLLRVGQVGHKVTQSEFDDLVVLNPFLGHLYVAALLRVQQTVDDTFMQLRLVKRIGKKFDPLLEVYWKNMWAMSHFMMLIGTDPQFLQQLFEISEARGEEHARESRTIFLLSPWMTGLMPWALRGAWLAAQLPKSFLKPCKVGFTAAKRRSALYTHGIGLAAIGHRHQRYRAEVVKFFQSAESRCIFEIQELPHHLCKALVTPFAEGGDEIFGKMVELECDTVMEDLATRYAPNPATHAYMVNLPHAAKRALMLGLPLPIMQGEDNTLRTFTYLPIVAKMQARDFYLPDRERDMLVSQGYTHRTGMAFIAPRIEDNRSVPFRAAVVPGRNDPCACGSGKKFKRCCAAAVNVA